MPDAIIFSGPLNLSPNVLSSQSADGGAFMPDHKFQIGDTVFLEHSLTVPGGGVYVVTRQLPERYGELEYQIRGATEPYDRVVGESRLSESP